MSAEDRVREEYIELDRKVQALEDFINYDMDVKVACKYHKRLLQEQSVVMKMYRNILTQRIGLFTIAELKDE